MWLEILNCKHNESICCLLFDCYIARNIWRTIFFVFHVDKSSSINHIIGAWESKERTQKEIFNWSSSNVLVYLAFL
jgi:hypothetical protein